MPDSLDIEDPAALLAYLRSSGRIDADETPTIRVLAGGVSNRTVWVGRPDGEAWVLKQALAKLRVAVDWFSSPERIEREALGMRHLERLAPKGAITPLVFEDRAHHVLAMKAVPEPHDNWKDLLLAGRIDPEHVRQFGTLLGTVHARAADDRATLEPLFAERGFFESLRLEPYYLYTAAQVPAAADFLGALCADTRRVRDTLVHGDYSPKNVLVHGGRLVLLDHEVIHFGDGAFDVGFALAHLLSKANHLAAQRTDFARAAMGFFAAYREIIAGFARDGFEPRAVRHALGCLLARVDGRSRLEYLGTSQRQDQRRAVVAMLVQPPATVADLVGGFVESL